MNIKDVAKLTPMERLLYWIREREAIRLKKEAGEPKPWTDDEILQRYRFCNVRRMDDKVSRWLLENWYQPYFNHPNMLVACALARFVNLPATLEEIGFPKRWSPDRIKKKVRALQAEGRTVYNGAYMVRGNDGDDKISTIIDYTIHPLRKLKDLVRPNSMEGTWSNLLPHRGWASFMAGQVVADLRHAVSGEWRDRNVWAPLGPGSRRGINRLFERPLNYPVTQPQFEAELEAVTYQYYNPRLEAMDYQNCLCEYDKYVRAYETGRSKRRYL